MMWKKRGMVLLSLVVLSFLLASCDVQGNIDFSKIGETIISIGSLQFLGIQGQTVVMGFLRVMVGILVFALFFEASRFLPFGRNSRVIIALVLATLSVVLIPGQVLIGISAAYSTLMALILIGVPVVGAFYLVYRLPSNTGGEIGVKLFILTITLWILWAMKAWITGPANKAVFGI